MIRKLLRKLTQRNRLPEYERILRHALKSGYRLVSLRDWYEHDGYPGEPILLLRHDVDLDPAGAYQMHLIEQRLGVGASYYFRWLTMSPKVVNQLHQDGAEVSLHFETLASFCKYHRIYSPEAVDDAVRAHCLEILRQEMAEFERRFFPIKTICAHGDHRNRVLGIPNQAILQAVDRTPLGLYFETYDESITSRFDCYISDSSVHDGHRWRYGISPQQAMQQGARTICLLTHPVHWHYGVFKNAWMPIKQLLREPLIRLRTPASIRSLAASCPGRLL